MAPVVENMITSPSCPLFTINTTQLLASSSVNHEYMQQILMVIFPIYIFLDISVWSRVMDRSKCPSHLLRNILINLAYLQSSSQSGALAARPQPGLQHTQHCGSLHGCCVPEQAGRLQVSSHCCLQPRWKHSRVSESKHPGGADRQGRVQ